MRLFTRRRRWERWGCGGYINRPTLLSPAERVFAEVRRWVEGRRYGEHRSEEGGGGRGAMTVGSRGEVLIAGRVALYPSSFECPAFMIKKLCL
jgi:hypothetical protein